MSERFTIIQAEMEARKMRIGFSYARMTSWLGAVFLFTVIGGFAVAISLGYRFTIQPEQEEKVVVQETATLQLNGPLAGLPVEVYLNGELVATELPLRLSRLEPKRYAIELKKVGYQSWKQEVTLEPYQRVNFSPVVLLYEKPVFALDPTITLDDKRFTAIDDRNLVLKEGSEIWLDDTFITRMSGDILSVRWFPGRSFIVVQNTDGLMLLAIDGSYTQNIITSPQESKTSFFFTEGGSVLVLQTPEGIQKAPLFEMTSFIDRLGDSLKTELP